MWSPTSNTNNTPFQYPAWVPYVLLIGALGLGGVLSVMRGQSMNHSHTTTLPDTEIEYTDTGFSPTRVTVPIGTRVTVHNRSSTTLWVVSDPHPTHTDYAALDAGYGYAPGAVFTYTFTSTGSFSFHNETTPTHRGFVRVTDHAHDTPDIHKTPAGLEPVRDQLLTLFDPNNPDTIFDVISAIQADPALSRNCHDIAHDLGHTAYELYGFSEAMTFNNPKHVKYPLVQYICAGGYLHGILEGLSIHKPEFLAQPDVICAAVPEADRASCYHGVGHVYMLANERDAHTSVSDCRRITEEMDTYRCFEGVRMEQFWGSADHTDSATLGWDTSDPLRTCIDAKEDEKPTCFLYVTFGYLRIHPKEYTGAVTLCTTNGLNESDTSFCLKGLGITMMSKFKGQHLEGSEVYVAGLPYQEKFAFYQGVMGYAHLSGLTMSALQQSCARLTTDHAICVEVLQGINE